MSKAIALHTRLRPRLAVEPVVLALVVVGGVGAYAFRNEASSAAKPREASPPHVAMALGYADAVPRLTTLAPPQVRQALLQAVAFQLPPVTLADSFQSALKPMTASVSRSAPLLDREIVPKRAPVPAVVVQPAAIAPVQAPPVSAATLPPAAFPTAATPPAAPQPVLEPVEVAAAPGVAAPVEVTAPLTLAEPAEVAAPVVQLDPAVPEPVAETQLAAVLPSAVAVPGAARRDAVLDLVVPAPELPAALPVQLPTPAPAALALANPAAKAPAAKPAPRAPLAKASPARIKRAALIGPQIPSRYKLVDGGVESQIGVQFYDQALGKVPLRVLGSGVPSLRLGDLLDLLKDRMDPARYETLSSSGAAEEFVSLQQLRDAGIPVRYDAARDQLKLGEE